MKKLCSLMLTTLTIFIMVGCEGIEIRRDETDGERPLETTLTLIVETEEGPIERIILLDEHEQMSVFDLLVDHFDVSYLMFDFGPMILSIESLVPSYGAFISILHNGEPSMAGAQDLRYESGDVITFELSWWDPTMAAVRNTITGILTNGLIDYFAYHPNLYVGAAIHHLGHIDGLSEWLTDAYQPETEGQVSQAVLLYALAGFDVSEWLVELDQIKTIAWPYATSLSVMALSTHPADNPDQDSYYHAFLADLDNRALTTLDADTLVLTYLALLSLSVEPAETLAETVLNVIIETLYTSSYGLNAATTAHQIIALVAAGLDPQEAAYQNNGAGLIDQLLAFYDGEGAFYYNDDSAEVDRMFSTPQAFLALVLYERYKNTHEPIHPFLLIP